MLLFDRILAARGLDDKSKVAFLLPDYSLSYDPFLLPDMTKAVERLIIAHEKQEHIIIYGDYDVDGLTATTLLLDAFKSFGFKHVDAVIPNRFVDGYGLTIDSVEKIAHSGAKLIVTVDCGSRSEKEIARSNELGVDVIVTDHHDISTVLPSAIAVVNPKRQDSKYPFNDLAGVGVAFKLVQALQKRLKGLPQGQEKWLLDLVALGTVCDIVKLVDENRIFVYWGLRVLSQTKRPGIRALMAISKVDAGTINARSLGFGLGPRMNAAGRLDTAQSTLDMLISSDLTTAIEKAQLLEDLNLSRRVEQAKIFKEATAQADQYSNDFVLVLSSPDWNHGVVGIVASKILEKYKKPVFVIQEMGDKSKGSARSYGDFSVSECIQISDDIIVSGGGHKLAAGIVLPTDNIPVFRKRINELYVSKKLVDQHLLLLPKADVVAEINELNSNLVCLIDQLEPFGNGNPRPILKSDNLLVTNIHRMGSESQHIKLELQNDKNQIMQFLAFNAPDYFFVEIGICVTVWYHVDINEWQGRQSVEGRLLHIETT